MIVGAARRCGTHPGDGPGTGAMGTMDEIVADQEAQIVAAMPAGATAAEMKSDAERLWRVLFGTPVDLDNPLVDDFLGAFTVFGVVSYALGQAEREPGGLQPEHQIMLDTHQAAIDAMRESLTLAGVPESLDLGEVDPDGVRRLQDLAVWYRALTAGDGGDQSEG